MALSIRLESTAPEAARIPQALAPPGLESLDAIISERKDWLQSHPCQSNFWKTLLEEHEKQQAPSACLRNILRLQRGEALAVVTGQQPGLLGGPLYTPWKIMSAISLAHRYQKQAGCLLVPVFWNAGEDHDTAEMDHFTWLSRDGNLARFEMNLPVNETPHSFGSRGIDQLDFDQMLYFWDEMLQPTDFSSDLKTLVGRAWQGSRNMGEFCNRLLWHLFPESGLVIVDSAKRSYQQTLSEIIQREVKHPLRSAECVNEAADRLASEGLRPKMHRAEKRCSFFLYEEDIRATVHWDGKAFTTPKASYSSDQLADRLANHPSDFSPAANLRPVAQDALLPVVISIVGPGEWAYHLQLDGVYKFHGIPRPALARRFHIRLLPPRIQRGLGKIELPLSHLDRPAEQLVKQVAMAQSEVDFEASINTLKSEIQNTLDSLSEQCQPVDKTLPPVIMKHQQQLLNLLEKLESKLGRTLRKSHQDLEQLLQRLQTVVRPEGKAQERVLNLFGFLNLFGPDLLPLLQSQLDSVEPGSHCEVWIEHESKKHG